MMEFQQVTLEDCENVTGTVVVIDVLRAFTTAAYAFASGLREIALVSTVETAFELKQRFPGAILMGEDMGLPIPGFDFGNSPTAFQADDLRGKMAIQRTSAGTQGVVKSQRAEVLLASSLCCAGATAGYIQSKAPEVVTFVITGSHSADQGDEDRVCADAIESLLMGESNDQQLIVNRVRGSAAARKFLDPNRDKFPLLDLEHALAVDKFNFAMVVERQDGVLRMKPLPQRV